MVPQFPLSECSKSNLVQIVEKEVEITPTEIGDYDTENEENSKSTKRDSQVSRY